MISTKVKIFVFVFAIYLILFEFLFPANGVFPPVSVIFLSVNELVEHYNFMSNLASTFAAVYISILGNYLVTKFLFAIIVWMKEEKFFEQSEITQSILSTFFNIPFILITLLILVWLPDLIYDKYIIATLLSLPQSLNKVFENKNSDKKEYYYFYKSLGIKSNQVMNKVIFRLSEPKLLLSLIKNHSFIWSVILITEFIQQQQGIGGILFTVFKYQDISLIFTIALLLSILVSIVQKILILLYDKIYFWK